MFEERRITTRDSVCQEVLLTMIRIFNLLIAALPLTAQITSIASAAGGSWSCTGSSPTLTCSTHERQHGFEVYPLKIITTGTYGSTSTSASGLTAITNNNTWKWCNFGTGATGCVTPTSGAATPELYIYFDGYTDNGYSAGLHSGSVTFTGGFTVNINLTIDAYVPPTIIYPGGSCVGCAKTSATFPDPDTITVTNIVPTGNFTPAASPGGSYTDPNLGGVVYTVLPPKAIGSDAVHTNSSCLDAIATCFNADGTLQITNDTAGNNFIQSTTSPFPIQWTNPVGRAGPVGTSQNPLWSSKDPKAFFYVSGTTVRKMVLGAPGAMPLCDFQIYSYSGTSTGLRSRDSEVTKDDWTVLAACEGATCFSGDDRTLVVLNLNGPSQCGAFTAASYTASFAGFSNFTPLTVRLSNTDVVSGQKYIVVENGAGGNRLYSMPGSGGTVTDMGFFPAKPGIHQDANIFDGNGTCIAALEALNDVCEFVGHMTSMEIGGIQGWGGSAYARRHPNIDIFLFERFSVGTALMGIDTAAGGGATMIFPTNLTGTDTHFSAARQGNVFVVSNNSAPVISTFKVTGATNTPTIHVTSSPAYTGANGDVLNISNVYGNTALNGLGSCTVANLSGTTFDCLGLAGNGAYVASTGVFYKNAALTMCPHCLENDVFNLRSLNPTDWTLLRHSISRSLQGATSYLEANGYYSQAHAYLKQDGSAFGFESNYGFPDRVGVYMGFTGFNSLSSSVKIGQGLIQ